MTGEDGYEAVCSYPGSGQRERTFYSTLDTFTLKG